MAWLVFQALLKVVKTTFSTAIAVFIIVIFLGIFGIGSEDLLQELTKLPETLMHLFTNTQSQIGV